MGQKCLAGLTLVCQTVMEVVVITANKLPERETRNASMGSLTGIPPVSVLSEDCGGLLDV